MVPLSELRCRSSCLSSVTRAGKGEGDYGSDVCNEGRGGWEC